MAQHFLLTREPLGGAGISLKQGPPDIPPQLAELTYGIPIISAIVDTRQCIFMRGSFRQTKTLAIESLVTICLAGPAAEELMCGPITDGGDVVDNRIAREYLKPHFPEITIGYHIHRLRGAAERLVRNARPRIKLIADALIKYGSLDAEVIYTLISEENRLKSLSSI